MKNDVNTYSFHDWAFITKHQRRLYHFIVLEMQWNQHNHSYIFWHWILWIFRYSILNCQQYFKNKYDNLFYAAYIDATMKVFDAYLCHDKKFALPTLPFHIEKMHSKKQYFRKMCATKLVFPTQFANQKIAKMSRKWNQDGTISKKHIWWAYIQVLIQ